MGGLRRAEPGVTSGEKRTWQETGRKLKVWLMPVIPALRRLQQEDRCELKASLD